MKLKMLPFSPDTEAKLNGAGITVGEFARGFRAADSCVVATLLAFHLGLRVLPIRKKTKIPCLKGWPDAASTSIGQIFQWRKNLHSDFSILTGHANGIWAFDIDGLQGCADLIRLSAELGPWPPTIKVISGRESGGFHYWFRADPESEDLRTVSKVLGSHIDVRGFGGQIVLPGSEHRSGARYQFAPGCAPDNVELAALPKNWLDALPKRQEHAVRQSSHRLRSRATPPPLRTANNKSTVIGDGEDRGGFDTPIYKNAIRYFFKADSEAPAEIIIEALRDMIIEAPKDHGRDVSRYLNGPDLPRIVERARAFVNEVKENESDEHDYE
jgi:hypothetical protein